MIPDDYHLTLSVFNYRFQNKRNLFKHDQMILGMQFQIGRSFRLSWIVLTHGFAKNAPPRSGKRFVSSNHHGLQE